MASGAGDDSLPPHFFFFPTMAAGHSPPMVNLAKLFAARGARATLVLTADAAATFHTAVSTAQLDGHPISIELIHFPPSHAGSPQTMDQSTNREAAGKFLAGLALLEPAFRRLVQLHRPNCIVSDMFLPWTSDVAETFDIPRLAFTGSSCFSYCANEAVRKFSPQAAVLSDDELFLIPDIPGEIYMTRGKLPNESASPHIHELFKKMAAAKSKTYGLVMNSFTELESDYINHTKKTLNTRTWSVGPVFLLNKRGKDDKQSSFSSEVQASFEWLDQKKPRSVLYICFGSACTFSAKQMEETAAALESVESPFLWVVKEREVLPEGFEERVGKEKGVVLRGWAPQTAILGHGAVGGFLTHCGWNSVLEGLVAGLPMVTWPAFAEQFYNEQMVIELLKVGVGVGAGKWKRWVVEGEAEEVVGRERIAEAVGRVMGEGKESEEMRRRAEEVAAAAKAAVAVGGSAYVDLGRVIDEIKCLRNDKVKTLA